MQVTYLAQAEQAAGSALSKLIESGTLGAVAALAIIALGISIVLLLKEKDKRIEDAQKVNQNIATPLTRMQESLERMEEKIIISKAKNNESN